jgi:hypothetical protein
VTDLGELVMNLWSAMHGGMELEVVAHCQELGQRRPWWLFFVFFKSLVEPPL